MPAKKSSEEPYIHYHKDGTVWAKGQTRNGKFIGYWEWFRKDGTKQRSGYFENGEQVGEWTTYDKKGDVYKITMIKPKGKRRSAKRKPWGGDMHSDKTKPTSIEEYISTFGSGVQKILERIRQTIRKAAPGAKEKISYRMPAFKLNGMLVYFAAWKGHIGLYPPISGDERLEREAAAYAGEKGNLQFPLDHPIPYRLIDRIVKLRVKQDLAKAKRKKERGGVPSRRH